LAGVKPLPAGVLWQDLQSVTPLWFMVAGVQIEPMLWQLPQLALTMPCLCVLLPVVGIPASGIALVVMPWQPEAVQVLDALIPAAPWSKLLAGAHADVTWQTEHWEVVPMWFAFATVQPLPV